MPHKKIGTLVHRKAYHRKGYTRTDGVRVKGAHIPRTTYRKHVHHK